VAQVDITKQEHKTKIANLKEGKNMGVIFDDEFKCQSVQVSKNKTSQNIVSRIK
jgi:hypothetical protein